MFELIFGGIFFSIGLIIGIVFIAVGIATSELLFGFIGGLIGLIFGGIGLAFLMIAFKQISRTNNIIKNGERVEGQIVEYRDDTSLYINDIPALDIIVRCIVDGQYKICQLSTKQTNESKYPLGAAIELAYLNDEVAIVPNSVKSYIA